MCQCLCRDLAVTVISRQVLVTLTDDNDQAPRFSQSSYSAVIFENVPPLSSVIDVFANDDDVGVNSELTFYEIDGDDEGLFEINPQSGLITTSNRTLRGRAGEYVMTVGVVDGGVDKQLTGNATVSISVLQTNNEAPTWVVPPVNNFTANVPEVRTGASIFKYYEYG